jgi:streptogramin lyase
MSVRSRSRAVPAMALAALVLFLAGAAQAQILTTVQTATPGSTPTQTATALDGTIWFVEETGNRVGTITPNRLYINEVNLIIPNSRPTAITVDRNGVAWFAESGSNKIGSYNRTTNSLVEYQLPGTSVLGISGISVDFQGQIWFTEKFTNRVGVLDPSRLSVRYVTAGTGSLGLQGIVCDTSGSGWFTQTQSNQIGMINLTTNTFNNYSGGLSGPFGIKTTPTNDIWFTEQTGGFVTSLNPTSGNMFQFPTFGGAASQPKYLDTFQNTQGQSLVSWTEPGTSQVGILNPSTGFQTPLPSQGSQPYGVSYGNDSSVFNGTGSSLWWTNSASSSLTGWFLNSSIVWRRPSVGDAIFASLDGLLSGQGANDSPGSLKGYRHLKLASVRTMALKKQTLMVSATMTHPRRAVNWTLASRDTFDDARIVLASLDSGTPRQATINPQTATIEVVTLGTPTQTLASEISRLIVPSTNADMYVESIGNVPNTGSRDQVTVHLGQCVTLRMTVKFRTGPFVDVTNDPDTIFFLDPPRGTFTARNVWCPNPEDVDKALTIYGKNSRPSAGQSITDTVKVTVRQ